MRAIILSAGQGRRLLPLTANSPKCLLPVERDRALLEVQLRTLAACGVESATVMVGFGAEAVERYLADHPIPELSVDTFFNPFFELSDNLVTCWLAQNLMADDFILLNGDTLFDAPILEKLLASPWAPLTLAINEKDAYDDDDMKVVLNGGRRLRAVGKTLDPEIVDGESIGLMLFRGFGVQAFRRALDEAVREPGSLRAWYLSVVDALIETLPIETASISGLWWGEVDCAQDLAGVRSYFAERQQKPPARIYAGTRF